MKKLLGGLAIALAVTGITAEARAAGTTETFTVAGHPTDLFVPSAPQAKPALVLMLHGCSQNAQDFEAATLMNDLAEKQGFYVVWPTQPASHNAGKCWNWFDPLSQVRGSGEPAELAAIVDEAKKRHTIDAAHVYVAGISAGGAMAAVMGATYPDVFAAIGVGSGLEYQAADSIQSGLAAQGSGGPNPTTQGDAIFAAMGTHARAMPVIAFHGTSDGTVAIVNGHQVIASYTRADADALGLASLAAPTTVMSQVDGGRGYSTETTNGPDNAALLVGVWVTGMDHAWAGGVKGASYTDSDGPDETGIMWSFFSAHSLTAPTGNVAPDGGVIGKDDGGGSSGGGGGGGGAGADGSAGGGGGNADADGGTGGGGSSGGCATATDRDLSLAMFLPLALAALALRARRRR